MTLLMITNKMLKVVRGKKVDEVENLANYLDSIGFRQVEKKNEIISNENILPEIEPKEDNQYKVIVDLGCGDGKQIYRKAKNDPKNLYIGIDSNLDGLYATSVKLNKKPAKGGINNLVLLYSSVENLPDEIRDLADVIEINFPWGSLLEGIVNAEEEIMHNIVEIAKDGAQLKIITTYGNKFEESFLNERELPELTITYINEILKDRFAFFGVELVSARILSEIEKKNLESPWGKKILEKRERDVFEITCTIRKM